LKKLFQPNFTSSLFNIYLMPRKKLVIDEKHVMSLKVVGLKKLCKKYKLPQRGRKTNLQDRILEHLQLGKYARAVEVKPIKQTTPKVADLKVVSEPEELKVEGKEQLQREGNAEEEAKNAAVEKSAIGLDEKPKPAQKPPSKDESIATSEGQELNHTAEAEIVSCGVEANLKPVEKSIDLPLSEEKELTPASDDGSKVASVDCKQVNLTTEVKIVAVKEEMKVGISEKSVVVPEDSVRENDHLSRQNKRTASEACIVHDDITTEKKQKVTEKLEKKELNEPPTKIILNEQSDKAGKIIIAAPIIADVNITEKKSTCKKIETEEFEEVFAEMVSKERSNTAPSNKRNFSEAGISDFSTKDEKQRTAKKQETEKIYQASADVMLEKGSDIVSLSERTSSEGNMSDVNTVERMKKTNAEIKPDELKEQSEGIMSKEECKVNGEEIKMEQQSSESELDVSLRSRTISKNEPLCKVPGKLINFEVESPQEKKPSIVPPNENVEKKQVEVLQEQKAVKKSEETIPKGFESKIQSDETVSEAAVIETESEIKTEPPISKESQSEKTDISDSKIVESTKQTVITANMKKKKKIIPTESPISNTLKKNDESKDMSDGNDGRPSKSSQNKKAAKSKNSNSEESYQRRRDHGRQDQYRNRDRNQGNRNNRNKNRNRVYQPGYQPQGWPYADYWSNNDTQVRNSLPLPQQQWRRWGPQGRWQQQPSYYLGGYGNDRRYSSSGQSWNRRQRGGRRDRDRRNAHWRTSNVGRRGRR